MKTYNELKSSKANSKADCRFDARVRKSSGCNYVRQDVNVKLPKKNASCT